VNVIDASGWLEYFSDGNQADFFTVPINDIKNLLIPSICAYEVFKHMSLERGEDDALRAIGFMSLGKEIDLNRAIAVSATQISLEHKLAMADSIIYASAQAYHATLWTLDEHFKDLPGVQYIEKRAK
jgi:predicted nucleic acid-binding protein